MTETDTDKINSLYLEDMAISKFTYKEGKILESLQQRIGTEQKNYNNKCYEISLSHNFTTDVLITNFQINLKDPNMFASLFQVHQAEANSISNRGLFSPVCSMKTEYNDNTVSIDTSCFSQSVKLVLNLKKDFHLHCEELLNLKKQKTKNVQEQNISKLLNHLIISIKMYGYSFQANPPATQLTKLLNISQSFKKNNLFEQQAQTDILLALCLINARRFIQASELLRKSSNYFVKKYISSKSHLQSTRYERSWMIKQYEDQNFQESLNISRNYSTGRVLEGSKYLLKAAKIQLLLAENVNHPSLINQKLQAYNRSHSYFNGNPNPIPIQLNTDIQQILFDIGPNLIVFLMKVLYDKAEILRISALKSIEYIYEAVGCSLSSMVPQILKTIVITYPSNQPQQNINSNIFPQSNNSNLFPQSNYSSPFVQQNQKQRKNISITKNKTLIDSYHHLLETFVGLVSLMNKKYLRIIFKQIILTNISVSSIKNQLKLYFLRFSQKIICLCGCDLDISVQFVSCIISLSEKKLAAGNSSQYIIHNISFFSQRIIDAMKNKIFLRLDGQNLVDLCIYLKENLVYFCQNQIVPENQFFFHILLDFILIIYQRKVGTKILCPIQPVIYFLNISISQQNLPFEKLLEVTIVLLRHMKIKNESNQINHEIISRIIAKSKYATLNIKQLKILEQVLKTIDQTQPEWLDDFLNCIPHSTFDEIYGVFNILFRKSFKKINSSSLQKIIDTFLDQYTVKGKAHEFSKKQMLQLFLNQIHQNSSLVPSLIEICFTNNNQPKIQDYSARKKRMKQHFLDTKMYKIHYEMFIEKTELFIVFLNKLQEKSKQFYSTITPQFVKQIYLALKKLLESKSSKIKSKALKVIYYFIQIFGDNIVKFQKKDLVFVKSIITILKKFISTKVQSKLHYQTVLNIQLLFVKVLKTESQLNQSRSQNNSQIIDSNFEGLFELQIPSESVSSLTQELRVKQFIKMYPALVNLLNSPWENIRQLILQTILQFLSNGIQTVTNNLQHKMIQIIKPMVLTYLQSLDHIERLGACKVIGCILGMSREFRSKQEMEDTFYKTAKYGKLFINEIYLLQKDWHEGISKIARIIFQVCLTPSQQEIVHRKISSWKKTEQLMQSSYCSFNLGEEYNFQKNHNGSFLINNFDNLQSLLKETSRFEDFNKNQQKDSELIEIDQNLVVQIGHFRNQIYKAKNLKTSFFGDNQSFLQKEEENYFQPNQQKTQSRQEKQIKSQQQPLEFQDLGIIDLDDEEWGEEQNEVKIIQKLPLKKIYKLSPNIGTSTKHQRIRSKRYFSHQFEPNDKIIVDELQGRINHDSKQKNMKIKKQKYLTKDIQKDKSIDRERERIIERERLVERERLLERERILEKERLRQLDKYKQQQIQITNLIPQKYLEHEKFEQERNFFEDQLQEKIQINKKKLETSYEKTDQFNLPFQRSANSTRRVKKSAKKRKSIGLK